jgi:hypothetical protein
MKPETIAALANKFDTTSEAGLTKLAKALTNSQPFPAINSMDLARLVEMRMRKKGGSSPKDMVDEIEDTLDLVQACELMLTVRRFDWQTDEPKVKKALFLKPDPSLKESGIRADDFPLKFNSGLIRMGVPETDREGWFWRFFKDRYPFWQAVELSLHSNQSVCEYLESQNLTDAEIRTAFDQRKLTPWSKPDLLNVMDQWERWYLEHKHDGQRLGGTRSAESKAKVRAIKKSKIKPRSSR